MNGPRFFQSPGFTLVEWLVSLAIMAILVVLVAAVCNGTQWVQRSGNRHLNADEEARGIFDRMAMDFAQMVKRRDVDCWLKGDLINLQTGNDQLAFFSAVPGYYPDDAWNSPLSVIGYWVDPEGGLQRYSCGLLWNGVNRSDPQMMFSGTSRASDAEGANVLSDNWSGAVLGNDTGNNEPAGPDVFRLEYYYILRAFGNTGPVLSAVPWDARQGSDHHSPEGLRDVAAIGVMIALIDPKARAMVSPAALADLVEAMDDFSDRTAAPGALESQWRDAVDAAPIPHLARTSIRIYRRWFYLNSSPLLNL